MAYGKYVGRVGALAVALGIGGAIGWPAGAAWAQTDGPDGDTGTTQTAGASASADTASGVSTTTHDVGSDQQSAAAVTEPAAPAGSLSGLDSGSAPRTSGSVTVTVDGSPSVSIDAQTNSSTDEVDLSSSKDNDGVEREAADAGAAVEVGEHSAVEDDTPAGNPIIGHSNSIGDVSTTSDKVSSSSSSSASNNPSTGSTSNGGGILDDVETATLRADTAEPSITVRQLSVSSLQPDTGVSAAALLPAADTTADAPAEPTVDVQLSQADPGPLDPVMAPIRAVVLGLLGTFGYDPNPVAPVSNPLLDTAWAFYRRIESLFVNAAPTGGVSTFTLGTAADGQTVLEGQMNFTDADYDHLTYTVVDGPATIDKNGKITIRVADPTVPVDVTVAVSDGTTSLLGTAGTRTARLSARPRPTTQAEQGFSVRLIGADAATVRRVFDLMAAMHTTWVRADFDWSAIEGTHGQFDWTYADTIVREASARGMKVLPILTYTPPWARAAGTTTHAPPTNMADFAAFARAAATRYAPLGVHTWEIWNEPNIGAFWEPKPDANRYGELFRAAATAIRNVDGKAVLLTGGLTPGSDTSDGWRISEATFLEQLYRNGTAQLANGIAIHPYSFPSMPLVNDPSTVGEFAELPALHDLMVRHGDGNKKIWITEFGYATGTAPWGAVSEATQSTALLQARSQVRNWSWAGPLIYFELRDGGTDRTALEQNFGVAYADLTLKPAGLALEGV